MIALQCIVNSELRAGKSFCKLNTVSQGIIGDFYTIEFIWPFLHLRELFQWPSCLLLMLVFSFRCYFISDSISLVSTDQWTHSTDHIRFHSIFLATGSHFIHPVEMHFAVWPTQGMILVSFSQLSIILIRASFLPHAWMKLMKHPLPASDVWLTPTS